MHNHLKSLYESQGKKGGPPSSKKPPSTKVRKELKENVDDIPWCELDSKEKKYISQHERTEKAFAKQLHQPIPNTHWPKK